MYIFGEASLYMKDSEVYWKIYLLPSTDADEYLQEILQSVSVSFLT